MNLLRDLHEERAVCGKSNNIYSRQRFVIFNKVILMGSTICISDHIYIVFKKIFQSSAGHDNAREPYLTLNFIYNSNGEMVEHITAQSRHRFAECNPSSLLDIIEDNEPFPLDTVVDPQEAEILREMVSDAITLLLSDCDGVVGLKTLQVYVVVEINQDEEDYGLMELNDAKFLCERRMSLLQKNVYMGATTAEKENCIICLDEFKKGEEVVTTPCIHRFHDACLSRWFERADLCPLCRFKIECF